MKHFHRLLGQQMPDGVGAFDPQHSHIVDLVRFAAGFLNAMEQAFKPQKILRRILFGHSKEKSAVTAAKVNMQRRGAAEDFLQIERREI